MDKDAEQEDEQELLEEDESDMEFVEDLGEDDEEWEHDLEDKVEEVEMEGGFGADLEDMSGPSKKKRRKGPRLEVEYEQEMDARWRYDDAQKIAEVDAQVASPCRYKIHSASQSCPRQQVAFLFCSKDLGSWAFLGPFVSQTFCAQRLCICDRFEIACWKSPSVISHCLTLIPQIQKASASHSLNSLNSLTCHGVALAACGSLHPSVIAWFVRHQSSDVSRDSSVLEPVDQCCRPLNLRRSFHWREKVRE